MKKRETLSQSEAWTRECTCWCAPGVWDALVCLWILRLRLCSWLGSSWAVSTLWPTPSTKFYSFSFLFSFLFLTNKIFSKFIPNFILAFADFLIFLKKKILRTNRIAKEVAFYFMFQIKIKIFCNFLNELHSKIQKDKHNKWTLHHLVLVI